MITGFSYASLAIQGARSNQEDACRFAVPPSGGTVPLARRLGHHQPKLLAVLADGMGGHAGGAEASWTACQTFIESFKSGSGPPRTRLAIALDASNSAISAALDRDSALAGMGSTLLAALFAEEGLTWISVGDSPLFLFRSNRLYQLNEDHSLAPVLDRLVERGEMSEAAALSHPRRHFLRSALTGRTIDLVDLAAKSVELEPGDWIILASDGIETLSHEEIADALAVASGTEAEVVGRMLVAAIESKGEPNQDNATIMVVHPQFAEP
jgi:protein phosphatase